MKNTLFAYTLGAALCALAGCQTTKTDEKATTFGTCAPENKAVRTVSEVKGNLYYDQPTQQYRLMVLQPGTVDVVDIGVVCGPLPDSWKSDADKGRKVVFSGTYKEYGPAAPTAPAGYTFYHLELSKLTAE